MLVGKIDDKVVCLESFKNLPEICSADTDDLDIEISPKIVHHGVDLFIMLNTDHSIDFVSKLGQITTEHFPAAKMCRKNNCAFPLVMCFFEILFTGRCYNLFNTVVSKLVETGELNKSTSDIFKNFFDYQIQFIIKVILVIKKAKVLIRT